MLHVKWIFPLLCQLTIFPWYLTGAVRVESQNLLYDKIRFSDEETRIL